MKIPRAQLLEQLAWRTRPRSIVLEDLESYGWDSDDDHFVITSDVIIRALNSAIERSMSVRELVTWAEDFECREDITYEDGDGGGLSEIIFLIANPEINYELTEDRLRAFRGRCESIKDKQNKAEMATPRKPSD